MAHFKTEIREDVIIKTLNIAGENYSTKSVRNADGGLDANISVRALVEQHYQDIRDDEVLDALDDLDFANESDIMHLLSIVSRLEK